MSATLSSYRSSCLGSTPCYGTFVSSQSRPRTRVPTLSPQRDRSPGIPIVRDAQRSAARGGYLTPTGTVPSTCAKV